uniref:putative F-box/FBD/LRR-repeat protein At1g78760 n=1 Tax=Erigeron canadensis TaxID=72917 RepID=UPI001CB93FF0|nr:putative F-box/FBD/LRR-repeat protein At1g78760 [Erigeron canadensis]
MHIDMDSWSSEKRKKEETDRLSSLPNHLIHKILSFISMKETVKTIALSSRYRFIWTTLPYLNFSTEEFLRLKKSSIFVTRYLTRRNSQVDVSSLKLCFRGKVTQPCVKKLMDYAFSHNIQQLDVEYLLDNDIRSFPLSLFNSGHSLKHLSLKKGFKTKSALKCNRNLGIMSTLDIPGLTTLYLQGVTFWTYYHRDNCVGLLSKCANLKKLTLKSCETQGMNSFSICHPGLSNLTLDEGRFNVNVVNVVAPKLENLTIRCNNNGNSVEYVISAPNLDSLAYSGDHPLHLKSTDHGFHHLKEADIRVTGPNVADQDHQMVCLLQHLHNVKFLTLNLKSLELLLSSMDLIAHEHSPFVNLKSLTIYPEGEMRGLPKGKVNLSTEVNNYLPDTSPRATLTMFSREEIIAVRDVVSVQKLMAELRVLLKQEIANTKTQRKAPMERNNAKMHDKGKAQPGTKMQLQIEGNITLIKRCWKDLSVQFEQRKDKVCLIISKLGSIEGLLKKLPATNRTMIQPCFSSLCAEADTVLSKIMKMQYDENQGRLSVCFHELATSTTFEPSS